MAAAKFTKKTTKDGKPYTHVELRGAPREEKTVSRDKAQKASVEMSDAHKKGKMSESINKMMEDDLGSVIRESEFSTVTKRVGGGSEFPQYDGRVRGPTFSEEDITGERSRNAHAKVPSRPPSNATVPEGKKAVTLQKDVPIQGNGGTGRSSMGDLAAAVAQPGQNPTFSHTGPGTTQKKKK